MEVGAIKPLTHDALYVGRPMFTTIAHSWQQGDRLIFRRLQVRQYHVTGHHEVHNVSAVEEKHLTGSLDVCLQS